MLMCVLLVSGTANSRLFAQDARTAIVGRVLTDSGVPIAAATVSAFEAGTLSSGTVVTGTRGAFRLEFAPRSQSVSLVVRRDGYRSAAATILVVRTDTLVIVADIHLMRATPVLAPMKSVAQRPRPPRDVAGLSASPGERPIITDVSSTLSADVSGDITGSLDFALSVVPGLIRLPDDGTAPKFSLAGLGSEDNRTTMSGMDVQGVIPRDGGVLRITTSSYDPSRSGSGAQTEYLLLGAGFTPIRNGRLTFDPAASRLETHTASALRQSSTPIVVSGLFGGPLGGPVKLFVLSFQGSHSATPLNPLQTLGSGPLTALQLSPDSVARLLARSSSAGLPADVAGSASQRETTNGSLLVRLDFTTRAISGNVINPNGTRALSNPRGVDHVFYLLLGGNFSKRTGLGVGPTSTLLSETASNASGSTVIAVNSLYLGSVLNETKAALQFNQSTSRPLFSDVPAALVNLDAISQGGGVASVMLGVGGSGTGPSGIADWTGQIKHEIQWSPSEGKRVRKLAAEVTIDHASATHDQDAGQFLFPTLASFEANVPGVYLRNLDRSALDVSGLHTAFGIGEILRPSNSLSAEYGVRLEQHSFRVESPQRPLSQTGVLETGSLTPAAMSFSPMAGATWLYGDRDAAGFTDGRHVISGGIRDYRSTPSAKGVRNALGATSLAPRQLRCVGDMAPLPHWSDYVAQNVTPPSTCSNGGTTEAQYAPSGSMYAQDYGIGHSWRADVTWQTPISAALTGSLHGNVAINTRQPSLSDANFAGRSLFRLPEEALRPVFVPISSIDARIGALLLDESRRDRALALLTERGSDARSSAAGLTISANYQPTMYSHQTGLRMPVTLSYSLNNLRYSANGFEATTDGDPRERNQYVGSGSRHSLAVFTLARAPGLGVLTLSVQARSGIRFTPVVAADINGDGFRNDRAFVPDPIATPDTALAMGIRTLLASAPRNVASCLLAQVGTIAGANSCAGPWTSVANVSVAIDPERIGLQNRGSLTLRLTNLGALVDRALHGDGTRGWGQAYRPDASLLSVRGFDAQHSRFLYQVNSAFGTTGSYEALLGQPWRVMLDLSVDVGPNREREAVFSRITGNRSGADSAELFFRIRGRALQLFQRILDDQRALDVSDSVAFKIEQLGLQHAAIRDSVYGALAGTLAREGQTGDDRRAQMRWHDAINAVALSEWNTSLPLRQMLTERQAAKVFSRVGPLSTRRTIMDRDELGRWMRTWHIAPI